MYNPEIKEKFMEVYGGGSKKSIRSFFESISSYENVCKKDFAEMTFTEAIEAIKDANVGAYGTAAAIPAVIKGYIEWCKNSSAFDTVNSTLMEIGVDDIDASEYLKKLVFRSDEELIYHLNSVRPYTEGYPEVIVMLLVWAGIKQNDVASIKISDVDVENRRVYLSDRCEYAVFSDRIADVFRIYERTKVGYRSSANGSRAVYRDDSYDRYVRKYFPKGKSGDPFTSVQIKHIVNHLNYVYEEQGNPPRFTGSNVLMSGALRRVWELEQSGVDVFSIKNKRIVKEVFFVKAQLYEILWLYKNYKKAFNL